MELLRPGRRRRRACTGTGIGTGTGTGTCTGTDQPHGWVEIYFDGTPYIFDTEMEYVYIYERGLVDNHFDMFMVSYSAGTYWNYKRYNG